MKKVILALLVLTILFITIPKKAMASVFTPVGSGTMQRCQDNPAHTEWWDWFWNCNYALPA